MLSDSQTVSIHPSSVLFSPGNQKKIEAIMYHELVFSPKSIAN